MAPPSRRIVLEDVTTPANERVAASVAALTAPRHSRTTGLAGPAGNLTFLAGIWMVISGIALNYHETGLFDAYWSDVVVGVALAVVALVCIVNPAVAPSFTLTKIALGSWLIVAPFVLSYSDVAKPMWNDIAAGVLVVMLAALGTGGERDRT